MKEPTWNTLAAGIRHGNTVLVLGSEIADAATGAVGQLEALRAHLAAELDADDVKVTGDTLAAVAQQYEDGDRGIVGLRASAERFYRSASPSPPPVYASLAALPFGLILTSSQDDAVVQCLAERGKKPLQERYHFRAFNDAEENPDFPVPSSPETPVVYHLFGHVRDPASLVLSENDILDFIIAIARRQPQMPDPLVRALQRSEKNFLFVGFGIRQWYLRVLLKVLVKRLELNHKGSTIAERLDSLPAMDREQTVLFYRRGTKIEVADTDLDAFVAELTQRVQRDGGYVGRTATGIRPRVFVSYASEDADLAARVVGALQKSNFEPWFDKNSLRPGLQWDQQITDDLDASDFAVVLHTPALVRKTDSYVNKEIALARERGMRIRSSSSPFVVPLRTDDLPEDRRIPELAAYHELVLRRDHFDEDIAKLTSHLIREYQRRNK